MVKREREINVITSRFFREINIPQSVDPKGDKSLNVSQPVDS
jgi:hypothetical protein